MSINKFDSIFTVDITLANKIKKFYYHNLKG